MIRCVKRDCSFEGEAKFSYIIQQQYNENCLWEDLFCVTEEIGEAIKNAGWETPQDSIDYQKSVDYVYSN